MSQQVIPRSVVEGRGQPFPAGTFIGTLKETKERWYKDEAGNNKTLFLDLAFANITPIDGPQVGARMFKPSFQLIASVQRQGEVKATQYALVDIVEFNDQTPIGLAQTAGQAAQLAVAFNAATVAPNGDVQLDLPAFIENLAGGVYNGQQVIFELKQRAWTNKKSGKSGVATEIVRFISADATTEASAPEVEAVAAPEAEPTATARMRTRA